MYYRGIEITGDTVGIAFINEMCSSTRSVGVTQDGGRSLSSTASIAAHELGHIFNMGHDGKLVQIVKVANHKLWLHCCNMFRY